MVLPAELLASTADVGADALLAPIERRCDLALRGAALRLRREADAALWRERRSRQLDVFGLGEPRAQFWLGGWRSLRVDVLQAEGSQESRWARRR
jgi:hypothetical protein